MNPFKLICGLSVLVLIFAGCAQQNKAPAPNPAIRAAQKKCQSTPVTGMEDYRYVLSEQHNSESCTTGCRIFQSLDAYCMGLLDDSLNHNCAKSQRNQLYQKDCQPL